MDEIIKEANKLAEKLAKLTNQNPDHAAFVLCVASQTKDGELQVSINHEGKQELVGFIGGAITKDKELCGMLLAGMQFFNENVQMQE